MPITTAIQFGDGLTVTDLGSGTIRVDGVGGPAGPGDATTAAKGIVQLAGDLDGTAASPQIATGVIVDADVAAAAAIAESKLSLASDAAAGTASRRTLGTGALQAAAGNDSRFLQAAVAYGTSLPGSPVDGREAVLVDSVTNPSYQWRFRWNAGSSSAYKWEYVGGGSLAVQYLSNQTPSAATWTGMLPNLTVPRAGEYQYSYSGTCNAVAAYQAYISLWLSGAQTGVVRTGAGTNQQQSFALSDALQTLTAGQDVRMAFYCSVAGGAFGNVVLSIRPMRVT